MSLQEQIAQDIKEALRAGDEDRKRALRMISTALEYADIEARRKLDEKGALAVLRRQARQRRECIAEFERAGRHDLARSERIELEIIESYLPPQMGRDQIEEVARRHIAALGAAVPQDRGRVMGAVMAELAGQADGKLVSDVVRQLLTG